MARRPINKPRDRRCGFEVEREEDHFPQPIIRRILQLPNRKRLVGILLRRDPEAGRHLLNDA